MTDYPHHLNIVPYINLFVSVVVDVDDRPLCVEICDTAGQVRHNIN